MSVTIDPMIIKTFVNLSSSINKDQVRHWFVVESDNIVFCRRSRKKGKRKSIPNPSSFLSHSKIPPSGLFEIRTREKNYSRKPMFSRLPLDYLRRKPIKSNRTTTTNKYRNAHISLNRFDRFSLFVSLRSLRLAVNDQSEYSRSEIRIRKRVSDSTGYRCLSLEYLWSSGELVEWCTRYILLSFSHVVCLSRFLFLRLCNWNWLCSMIIS